MNIKDYWTQPPQIQNEMITESPPKPQVVRLPKPKGCNCKVADARACATKKRQAGSVVYATIDVCPCSCHTETGGFD